MQELYLTKQQFKRLAKGVEVILSRKGQEILISLKGAASKRVKIAKKVEELEAELRKLRGSVKEPKLLLNFKPCSICNKSFGRLDRHMAWKHEGKRTIPNRVKGA